ncbi:unnamed protein product, partial [Closterium sp. NIES-53]
MMASSMIQSTPKCAATQAALLAGEPVLRGATSAPASLSPATWLPLGRCSAPCNAEAGGRGEFGEEEHRCLKLHTPLLPFPNLFLPIPSLPPYLSSHPHQQAMMKQMLNAMKSGGGEKEHDYLMLRAPP